MTPGIRYGGEKEYSRFDAQWWREEAFKTRCPMVERGSIQDIMPYDGQR